MSQAMQRLLCNENIVNPDSIVSVRHCIEVASQCNMLHPDVDMESLL